jgi:hypothetical protein
MGDTGRRFFVALGTCGLIVGTAVGVDAGEPASAGTTRTASAPTYGSLLPKGADGGQTQAGRRADVRWSAGFAPDGSGVVIGSAGEVEYRKQVFADGRFAIWLKAPKEVVRIDGSPGTVRVVRGNRSAVLDLTTDASEGFDKVRALLAGSKAVRLFRLFAATLDPSTEETAAGTAILVSDALVGWLDGDVGAARRLGRQMADRYGKLVRHVRLQDDVGCYREWESEVVYAWEDYEACQGSFDWWNPLRELCSFRWILWVESAWFSFLTCSAFPMR